MYYSFMSFSTPALTLRESLETAKHYGYSGFEPRMDSGHKHGIETSASGEFLLEARKLSEEMEIKFSCVATSCKLANPNESANQIEAAKKAVLITEKIGCHAIRVFGGKLPEGLPREKAIDTLTKSLSQLSKYAKQYGVYICLETHDDWCDPVIVGDIAKKSGCSVNWDIMHTFLTAKYSPEKAFEILKPYIRHVHIHDGYRINGDLLFKSIGSGEVDHSIPINLLKKSGYNEFISGEWINWEPWEQHLPREIGILKKMEN